MTQLKEVYDKAWGKSWPTTTCTIHRCDIFPDETNSMDVGEDMDIDGADDDDDDYHIPTKATFTCLLDVGLLRAALGISGTKFSVIVIREEYKLLCELLKKGDNPFIVTGQPGIGKTVFLLYLLLYRFERALPTAVQFSPNEYIVFKADGVSVCPTNNSIDHWSILPDGCWCLSDGNADVMYPCEPFWRDTLRTFLITSSSPDSYKKWRTQAVAGTIITALPQAVEVAAIAKMNGLKPCDAVSIMRKWGPSTRMVVNVLRNPNQENNLRRYAVGAATDISTDPSKISSNDIGLSTLLFICPIRCKDNPDYGDSRFIIPTMHLSKIFDTKCQGLSIHNRMKLYELFSPNLMTSPAGWQHEKNMHLRMTAMDRKRYEIFNGSTKHHMNSATLVPVGTASGLRDAARKRPSSFYWFPSVVNYPGIDGILVNCNDIYALQATITDTHRGPQEGLKKVWKTIGADVARGLTWHFVVITDNKDLADKYAMDLGNRLSDVALGRRPHVMVSVWVCVIENPAVHVGR